MTYTKNLLMVSSLSMALYSNNAQAIECTAIPKCPDLGFITPKSKLETDCKLKTRLKCPFGDYYFCSQVMEIPLTCDQQISKARGIKISSSSQFTSYAINGKDIYLTANINNGNQINLDTVTNIHSANTFNECKSELVPPITISVPSIKMNGSYKALNIHVPLTTDNLELTSGTFSNLKVRNLAIPIDNTMRQNIVIYPASSVYTNNIDNITIGSVRDQFISEICTASLDIRDGASVTIKSVRTTGKCKHQDTRLVVKLVSSSSKLIYGGTTYTKANCASLNTSYIKCSEW